METIDFLYSTGQTSADLTPMKRLVLFIDDICKVSFENNELIQQSIRRAE